VIKAEFLASLLKTVCDIINVTFDQFNASLLNKSINLQFFSKKNKKTFEW